MDNSTTQADEVKVTQADRIAAADLVATQLDFYAKKHILAGDMDDHAFVQAFARQSSQPLERVTQSEVNAGNIVWRGDEWVPLEAYQEAMAGWKAASQPLEPQGEAVAWHTKAIALELEEGSGVWKPCSGCQESSDGYVSTKDYPYNETFRCQPGSGCRECGGLGVLWDDTDYAAYARFCMDEPQPQAGGDEVSWIDIIREWFGGERYARDYEYLDANFGGQARQVADFLNKRAAMSQPTNEVGS